MATTNQAQNQLEYLLKQYEQCREDKRSLESMIWQTPTISLVIISILFAGAVSQKFTLTPSTAANAVAALTLFAFAFAVSLVATIQLSKHRLFADIRVAELRDIEKQLAVFGVQAFGVRVSNSSFPVFFTTDEVKRMGPTALRQFTDLGLLTSLSAYRWLFGLMAVVTTSLLIAAILVPMLLLLGII